MFLPLPWQPMEQGNLSTNQNVSHIASRDCFKFHVNRTMDELYVEENVIILTSQQLTSIYRKE